MLLLIVLFVLNAVAHIISYLRLKRGKDPNALGVGIFVCINALIAILFWQELDWAKWVALIFSSIGALGLLITTILKGSGTWIDYAILILDVAIIVLVLNHYFL